MKIIGHRGARGLAPENTLAALRKALEHDVDEIEFDLRMTKDHVVILHHDPYLTDPNGVRHTISDNDYSVLAEHKPDLATFEKVLDSIGESVPLLIEVKPGEPTAPIVRIIKDRLADGWKPHNFLLASFSQRILREFQAALPDIELVVNEKWSGVRAHYRLRQLGASRVSMNQRWLWWGFIRSVSRGGTKLAAYTLNDPAKARRWQRHGLDAVITDYPDRFQN